MPPGLIKKAKIKIKEKKLMIIETLGFAYI